MPFPSPATGHEEPHVSETLMDYLVGKPSSTRIVELDRDFDLLHLAKGDLLVIEQGRNPHNGCTALVELDGDSFCVQLYWNKGQWYAITDERSGKVTEDMTLVGVATRSIKNQMAD